MSKITLHHVPGTRSDRVLWLLREMGLEAEVRVWPFDKALRGPEFLALNPAGRVPALEMGGRSLWESGAIIEMLCETHPETGLGRAPGEAERADWLILLHFAETISQHSAALTQQHIALREDWMRSPVVMKLEAARVGKCFDAIEARLAGDWLLSSFSAADVAVGQAVMMARHFHRIGDRPQLAAWLARCESRPACPVEPVNALHARDFYEVPDA
ncbi:glutathione S-transferase family protein [Jannaschia rubra]|uniref:Glutathione S-transferase GST-6.0 n=1 Tax=Jannaschia rubra TaxID=282197 RepID=A0A0M6XR29_9RHOB|nr:glutathione S-transferase family protein [Jannaschia rubra]CTQ33560.1 Glutathione S-transferase GST-6.0 [Jannaschia rubra]SFG03880.1 glutathione S-transferase [Jannaschia rubra]